MELGEHISYERLRQERERLGISVEELANILDVAVVTVRNWEAKGFGKNYIPYSLKYVFKYWDVYAPYAKSGAAQKRAPGTWVSYVLRKSRFSASELARALDVSHAAVTKWKQSETIPVATEYAIRYALEERHA